VIVEVSVDRKMLDALRYLEEGDLDSYLILILPLVVGMFLINLPSFYRFLSLYLVCFSGSFLFFFVFLERVSPRGRRYSGLIRIGLISLLIMVVMDFAAFFFWFSMPRGPDIAYAPSYTTDFLVLLVCSSATVYVLFIFLKTIVEFDIMLGETPKKLPVVFLVVVSREDEHYVVRVNRYVLYLALGIAIFGSCYYSWIVVVSVFVDIFAVLGIFLAAYIILILELMGSPLVRNITGTKMVVKPKREGEASEKNEKHTNNSIDLSKTKGLGHYVRQ